MMKARLFAVFASALFAADVLAGPPILCNPIEIGPAKTLAMGSGPLERDPALSAGKAVDQTIEILKSESSPLVHMETLRRATVYVSKDQPTAKDLLTRVMALSLDAQGAKDDQRSALALFDAGFLASCYAEMGVDVGFKPGEAEGLVGYGWIKAAIDKLPSSAPQRAEMEFGAALCAHPMDHRSPNARALYDAHLKHAAESAKEGSLLAANIKAHHAKWDPYLSKEESTKNDGEKTAERK